MRVYFVILALVAICFTGLITGCPAGDKKTAGVPALLEVKGNSAYWNDENSVHTRNLMIQIQNVTGLPARDVNVRLYEHLPNGLEAKVTCDGITYSTGIFYVEGIWPAVKPGIAYVNGKTSITTVGDVVSKLGDDIVTSRGQNIEEILSGQTNYIEVIYKMRE